MMDCISALLDSRGVRYMRIDGNTSAEARNRHVEQFQSDDQTKVALLSITAANAGLTLTAAKLVVFAELFWNPGILTQAEDRAHRIGQSDSIDVRYLVARGTADDVLWPLLQSKLDVLNKAGLSKDNFMGECNGSKVVRVCITSLYVHIISYRFRVHLRSCPSRLRLSERKQEDHRLLFHLEHPR